LKYSLLKIFSHLALLVALILFCGCQVKPDETVNSFLEAVADKNLNKAAIFCTKSFREEFTNLPSALKNYKYSIKKINWDLRNLYVNQNGFMADVYVSIEREQPAPRNLQALLAINLTKENGKWYISSVQSTIPEYIEFTTKQQKKEDKYFLFTLVRPRWMIKKNINEPLSSFVKQYDRYCYSWLH